MEREKVISWLEGLAEADWRECYSDSEVQESARQALDLIDELLKEQEAKTVESIQMDRSDKWGADLTGYCPSCKRPLKNQFNNRFCGNCKQELKWDD